VSDPEMISLMGFFEEDVGPDTISDMTTTVIIDDLAAITEAFCLANSVPLFSFDVCKSHKLPKFIDKKGHALPILLVPEDIVRELGGATSPHLAKNLRRKISLAGDRCPARPLRLLRTTTL
jgi:hypothetical protein